MSDRRPDTSEYDARYQRYLDLVPETDIADVLERQLEVTRSLLASIPADKVDARGEPGEWSPRETFGHILDTERIFGYRALCFARGDQVALQRADQELYVREGRFERYPIVECLEEFTLVRRANVAFLRHLSPATWDRSGTVSGLRITVRAVAYLMLGHERHHLRIIQAKYLAD